jgi:hypothetical protein
MAITYPLSLPTVTGIRRVRFTMRSVVAIARSPFTLDSQVQAHQGQRWEAEVVLPPMARANAEMWLAFLAKLNGPEGTFLLGDLAAASPRGAATGTPLVNGGGQTGNDLVTDGWTPSVTGILKAGDYIQLGAGATARLHKVLDDADSDAGGNATLTLWPKVTSSGSPADNAAIVTSSAQGVFRLASNETVWEIDEAAQYGLVFAALGEV